MILRSSYFLYAWIDCVNLGCSIKLDFLIYPIYCPLQIWEFVKKPMQYNLNPVQLEINKAKVKKKMRRESDYTGVYGLKKISVFAYMAVLF